MKIEQLQIMSVVNLLQLHGALIEELRCRNILRTKNNPVGDYAEWLVCTTLGLSMQGKSSKCIDACAKSGMRYQIKARRLTPDNGSVQLGAIRNLDAKQFDYLLAVLFNADFSVKRAARIPYDVVGKVAKFRPHTNCHVVHLRESVFAHAGVTDITNQLRT